jgi:hypothetical protein
MIDPLQSFGAPRVAALEPFATLHIARPLLFRDDDPSVFMHRTKGLFGRIRVVPPRQRLGKRN